MSGPSGRAWIAEPEAPGGLVPVLFCLFISSPEKKREEKKKKNKKPAGGEGEGVFEVREDFS